MCLTLRFKTRQELRDYKNNPLIAKKDIIVYKLLYYNHKEGTLTSPFRAHEYNKGEWLYQIDIKKFSFRCHKPWDYESYWLLDINKGLHSYSDLKRAKAMINEVVYANRIYPMIIPKGSQYYINKDKNEIVSDNLIFPWDSKAIRSK